MVVMCSSCTCLAVQVLVSEGKEPPCFLQLFQGGLIVHKGSREDGANKTGENSWRLFCVRGEVEAEASLVEVDCQRSSLRSRTSLVLLSAQKGLVYLWHGCKAHANARQVAKRAADRIQERCPSELGLRRSSSVTIGVVEEGSEPAEFTKVLGSQDKAYDCMLQGTCSRSRTRQRQLTAKAPVGAVSSRLDGVTHRSWEVQLHPPAVPSECQLRRV